MPFFVLVKFVENIQLSFQLFVIIYFLFRMVSVMKRPKNGIYIIQGEISLVVTAMRRSARWGPHNHQVSSTVKPSHVVISLKQSPV